MKTILFILLPFFAVSQSPETASEIKLLQGDQMPIIPYGVYDKIPEYQSDWLIPYDPIIRMSDLLQYQTECYNDSMQVTRHINTSMSCMYMLTGDEDTDRHAKCLQEWHKDIQVWIHREPTFTGFIEWLKRKQ